jgi:hypothetical protein
MTVKTETIFTETTSIECCRCGLIFWVSTTHYKKLRRNHKSFYCPAGHRQYFSGESDNEALKRQLKAANQREETYRYDLRYERGRVRAQKAAKTKIKNRIAKGVCPCCNRTFENLAKHMTSKHPKYLQEVS